MATIDVNKFVESLNKFKSDMKPSDYEMDQNYLMAVYWKAIDVSIMAIIQAATESSVD